MLEKGPGAFAPNADEDWPDLISHLRGTVAGRLNVYRTMAHHPALLAAWEPLRNHVVKHTALGKTFSEIVILRAGFRFGSAYEWAHHVSRGRARGLSDDRIASMAGPLEDMVEDDRILASAVDMLVADQALSSLVQKQLLSLVGLEGIFDLIATVGFYTTLACVLKSFGTPLDTDVANELAERPLSAGTLQMGAP
ncbi:carboxymuconolactone decarboxylase family protein [Neorhizobium sp. LjRoot104]|uniref:carboxymuconolactone decarboxylase family protein n=1 Tax=Neorhizobium sp. LjRoot104 TaxID=3342254 RepID=UPI003ECD78CC